MVLDAYGLWGPGVVGVGVRLSDGAEEDNGGLCGS